MKRRAGVLLSISSLPSKEGIGTLGAGAYAFVDFLAKSGFSVWQVLPLTPTREGNSPYSSISANALNPLFIDLFDLVKRGLLSESEIKFRSKGRVDYDKVIPEKKRLLRLAFSRFDTTDSDFVAFVKAGEYEDYARFSVLSDAFGGKPFWEWGDFAEYDEDFVSAFLAEREEDRLFYLFTQYLFAAEWRALKDYAGKRGISIFGDMPIYVAMNSAEVYFHSDLFLLDARRRPSEVAGVPPDYFNSEGQLWGNPLYDWEKMKEDGYRWWRDRIHRELSRFDILRIDHFRGLDRFYAIKADAEDAKHGVWKAGPGAALFKGMTDLPIVAEDLGFVDDSLRKMLETVGFPGMKVYEFGLDGDPWSEHKPANYKENVVGYTGTHDNMPFRGYLDSLKGGARATAARDILIQATALSVAIPSELDVAKAIGVGKSEGDRTRDKIAYLESLPLDPFTDLPSDLLTKTAIVTLFASRSRLTVVPMQDLLALGAESRMNTPALVGSENWAWRLDPAYLTDRLAVALRDQIALAERE